MKMVNRNIPSVTLDYLSYLFPVLAVSSSITTHKPNVRNSSTDHLSPVCVYVNVHNPR